MNYNQLLQYVKSAKDLESALFTHKKIEEGARAKAPSEPQKPQKCYVVPPFKPVDDGQGVIAIIIIIMAIAFIIAGVLCDESWLLILCGIFALVGGIITAVASEAENTSYASAMEKYDSDVARAESEYSRKMARYEKDLQQYYSDQMAFQRNILPVLSKAQARLQQSLDALYAADIIFPKYRNFVAVSAIYEYLSSGRCDRLDGPNGAYNLYETELRQNIIIGQLSDILSNLETIKTNQYTLYQEITLAGDNVSRVLCNIENQSALTAYYSEVSAKSTEASKCLAAIKGS